MSGALASLSFASARSINARADAEHFSSTHKNGGNTGFGFASS
jgi:hypothetical protein